MQYPAGENGFAVEPDAVIEGLARRLRAARDAGNSRPVVTFIGWVETSDAGITRLYPDSWLTTWFEIPTDAIVEQINGAERPHDERRSVLWVYADATVNACNTARADSFAETTPAPPVTESLMRTSIWPHRP